MSDSTPNLNDLPETISDTINEYASPVETITTDDDIPAHSHHGKQRPNFSDQHIFHKAQLDTEATQRYVLGDILGSGSSGDVWELIDNNLDRSIAVKFLSSKHTTSEKSIRKFVNEALITSRLEHPNILPIYDLEFSDDQQLYYSMKKVDGVPLSSLTENNSNNSPELHRDIAEIVNIFIKVSETIAYAHSRHIIHRDIKPDNIMLGSYGEVCVVDWGIALDMERDGAQSGRIAGTPVYMSPEQANCLAVDERSDIYCIGTTLFHTLFKRTPVQTIDLEDFWNRKKHGDFSELSKSERDSVPAPLLAICLKCMEADPNKRYTNANELTEDLKRYLIGGTVGAHHYTLFFFLKKWIQKNKTSLLWVAIILIVIASSAWLMHQQKLREHAGWGAPIYTQYFEDDSWKDDWIVTDGTFKTKDNQLVTEKGSAFHIFYKYPIQGGARIDFTGKMLNGFPPGDLTIAYAPDIYDTHENGSIKNVHYLQSGGQHNECASITTPDGRIAYKKYELELNNPYRFRGEIDSKQLNLYINGELICSYELPLPLNSGYIGFYGYYAGKSFDDVQIYNRQLPEITNIIKTGDVLFDNKLYAQAAVRYRKINDMYPNTAIGDEAIFKQGLCHVKTDQLAEANKIWSILKSTSFKSEILFYNWEQLYEEGNFYELSPSFNQAYQESSPSVRKRLKVKWSNFLKRAINNGYTDLLIGLLKIRDQHFPKDQVFAQETFKALQLTHQAERALKLFPEQPNIMAKALVSTGQFEKLFQSNYNNRASTSSALFDSANYDKVMSEFSDAKELVFHSLLAKGQFDDITTQFSSNKSQRNLLFERGKYHEALMIENNFDIVRHKHNILYNLERFEEIINNPDIDEGVKREAYVCHYLKQYLNGDLGALEGVLKHTLKRNAYNETTHHKSFPVHFLVPILQHLSGDRDALEKQLYHIRKNMRFTMQQRLWHNAGLLQGKTTDEVYLKQPRQHKLECDYLLYKGLHEDLYGDKKAALPYYKKLLDLPHHQRFAEPAIYIFIQHRIDTID